MALPPAILQFVEEHGCFSGCYGSGSDLDVVTTAGQLPEPVISVTCLDCLHHVGVLKSLLPKNLYSYQLADQLTRHVRGLRGYTHAVSGYHGNGPGFWLSVVYWSSCSVFLLEGERSRRLGSDLDLLMLAFKHGVLKPPMPGMTTPAAFTTTTVYHDVRQPMPAVSVKADLLSAPGISSQAKKGWKKLTVAEFAAAPSPQVATATPVPASTVTTSPPTDRCPKCGAEVRERTLLHQTFVGCMC